MAGTSAGSGGRPSGGAMRMSLNDPTFRAIFWQVVVIGGFGLIVWWLISNTLRNLEVRAIATGWDFLSREAGFAIGESVIEFEPEHSYGRALWVGILNTLRVAIIGIFFATILGTIIGIGRLSKNWLVAKSCSVYVEFMRNLPLLVQLFFWWAVFQDAFPGPREALQPRGRSSPVEERDLGRRVHGCDRGSGQVLRQDVRQRRSGVGSNRIPVRVGEGSCREGGRRRRPSRPPAATLAQRSVEAASRSAIQTLMID
jgi:His/Glu/Gln/Arg/opine family amino acid ABC transporter permease subunit